MKSQRPTSQPGPRTPARRLAAALLPALVGLAAPLAACGQPGAELVDTDAYATANGEPTTAAVSNARVGITPEANGPAEIYYDLTAFDWYRRGEPLIADGREYRPDGIPEAERARVFEPAGEYMGVTYYVLEGSLPPHLALYVPVSPGYWQPFTATPPAEELDT